MTHMVAGPKYLFMADVIANVAFGGCLLSKEAYFHSKPMHLRRYCSETRYCEIDFDSSQLLKGTESQNYIWYIDIHDALMLLGCCDQIGHNPSAFVCSLSFQLTRFLVFQGDGRFSVCGRRTPQ